MDQLKMIWRPCRCPQSAADTAPPGFEIRPLSEDMIEGWCEAEISLTGDRWTKEQFISKMIFTPPLPLSPAHIYCAVQTESGKVAASASACIDGARKHGNLHMVSAHPDYKGKKLGKAVCAAAVKAFLAHGVEEADLHTDDFRVPAIAIYLSLGFLPFLYEEDMRSRWEKILPALGIAETEAYEADKSLTYIKAARL